MPISNQASVIEVLPKVGDKLPPRVFRGFDASDLLRYAEASGDDNPIHVDAAVARRAGLESSPVQGMLLMTCFEPALEAWRPDLKVRRLSGKFLRPLFVGESIEISGRVVEVLTDQAPHIVLRLLAHNSRREMAVLAEASLVPATSDDAP